MPGAVYWVLIIIDSLTILYATLKLPFIGVALFKFIKVAVGYGRV